MRKYIWPLALLLSSFLGGAFAQTVSRGVVPLVQAVSNTTAFLGAATTPPSWVDSIFGFTNIDFPANAVSPLVSVSPNGRWAAHFATRSSDYSSSAGYTNYTAGQTILAMMDNTSNADSVWGTYTQGMFPSGAAAGHLINEESSISNQNATVVSTLDPFTPNVNGETINTRLDCGVGSGGPSPKNDCTSALHIINNSAKYASPAIIIGDGAMDTGSSSNPPTIAMPSYDAIAWYSAAGTIGGSIFTGSGSPAGVVSCTNRCLYIRTDGGASTTLYVNETGGGTSGWAAK